MPLESFHSLQEDWKLEIQHMFDDLRTKEKVKAGDKGGMQQDPSSDALGSSESRLPEIPPPFGYMQCVLHVKTVSCWWTNKKKAACPEVLTGDTACCLGLALSMIANIKRG